MTQGHRKILLPKATSIILVCAAMMLASCSSEPRKLSAAEQEIYSQQVRCYGADECTKLWRKAQVWAATHSGYKIQTATDSIIDTYNAMAYSTSWAIRIIRVPGPQDVDELQIFPDCGPAPLCRETKAEIVVDFKRAMIR